MNALVLAIIGLVVGLLCYFLLRRSGNFQEYGESPFLFIKFATVACFLGLIGYAIYQSLDLSDLLVGLLWLAAGILLLSAVIATIEKLEHKFRQKKGSDESN